MRQPYPDSAAGLLNVSRREQARVIDPSDLLVQPRALTWCSSLWRRATASVQADASRAEWVWLGAATLLVLLLTLVPPTVGRAVGPQDRVHVGTFWYTGDFTQYLAAMHEGASGPSWLIRDHFSAEPHDPVFMYPLYVAIGKIAAASQLPTMSIFAACELLMRLTLPIAVYVFLSAFVRNVVERRLGFVLAVFSGGFVIWLDLGRLLLSGEPGATTMDLTVAVPYVEMLAFATLFAAPHIGLGLALTLLSVVCFLAACRGRQHAFHLLAGATLLLGLVHPFNLPVLPCIFLAYGLLETLVHRHLAWRPLQGAALTGLVAAPFVLYNFATFTSTAFWSQTYGAQQSMLSPPPWAFPIIFGIVFLLAPLGVYRLGKTWKPEQRLLVTFVVVELAWMYVPVPYQRRFALGLQPALAAVAALGWPLLRNGSLRLVERLKVPASRRSALAVRLALYPLLILGVGDSLWAYSNVVVSAATNHPSRLYFVGRDKYEASYWVAQHSTQDDVTAAEFLSSAVLGGLVPGAVVVGNPIATLRFQDKLDTMVKLYRGELSADAAERFLAENRVRYVLEGPEEREWGDWDPGLQLGLPIAARIGDVVIYERPPGGTEAPQAGEHPLGPTDKQA